MDKLNTDYTTSNNSELDELYQDMLADFNIYMEQAGFYD